MIDKELFEMPRDEEPRGPGLAIIVVSAVLWLLAAAAGYGLVRVAVWWSEAIW